MEKYEYKVSAAGRVNLIGEHVDYCGGKVFPAALSLKNTVYARANGTDKINLSWSTLNEKVTLDINRLEDYKGLKYGNYQAGSAFMWKNAGHKIVGADLYMDCTVPFGSGLSSSAAIEVSTIAALGALAGETVNAVEAALLAQKAEREYAGVNCGIMDQYASACGKKGNAMLLDCKTLDCEYVPVKTGEYSIVLIDSKKPHNLAESKYNERRAETEEALRILAPVCGISCLAELSPEEFEKHKNLLSETVKRRTEHVVYECDRVKRAADFMRAGDMKGLGKLLNASHKSLSELYEVTGKELDTLAAVAQSHSACAGSRMTGAGFGGCTVSLVKTAEKEDFEKFVLSEYEKKIGYAAKCYEAEISDGIIIEKL